METATVEYKNIIKSMGIESNNKKEVLMLIYSLVESICEDFQLPVEEFQYELLSELDRKKVIEKFLQLKRLSNAEDEKIYKKEFSLDTFKNFSKQVIFNKSYRAFIYDNIKDKLLE